MSAIGTKPETRKAVEFTDKEIDRCISGIADVLQWMLGFQAALPEDSHKRLPGDWDALRVINRKLREARGDPDEPMPF